MATSAAQAARATEVNDEDCILEAVPAGPDPGPQLSSERARSSLAGCHVATTDSGDAYSVFLFPPKGLASLIANSVWGQGGAT